MRLPLRFFRFGNRSHKIMIYYWNFRSSDNIDAYELKKKLIDQVSKNLEFSSFK